MIHPNQPGILTESIEFNQFLAKSLPNMVSDIGLGAERGGNLPQTYLGLPLGAPFKSSQM
ncbi:hypothetical protein AAG906_015067 [Vitis piasezkii]